MRVVAHLAKTQGIGGAESHLLKLLPALAASDWSVHLISIGDRSHGDPTPGFEAALRHLRASGVRVWRASVRSKGDALGTVRLARTIRQIRPDLVHTHLPYADLFGALGARMAGAQRILSSRHRDYSTSPEDIRRFRRYYRVANRLHDRVITASHHIAHLSRTEEGRDPATIHVVWYGCEDQAVDRGKARSWLRAECGLNDDTPLIGTIGRLIPLKGHRYALEGLAAIASSLPNVVWLFAGAGCERQALEGLARSLGLSSNVRFLGHREDVPRILAALDLVVHPALVEGFGMAVLEAMVQGVPVIATRTGALPEVVMDGVTGVLVPPKDWRSITEAAVSLLSDPARMARLGKQGRARYEECFGLDRMVRQTIEVYDRVGPSR